MESQKVMGVPGETNDGLIIMEAKVSIMSAFLCSTTSNISFTVATRLCFPRSHRLGVRSDLGKLMSPMLLYFELN